MENSPTLGKTIDNLMLTLTGGKERTLTEHEGLLRSARFGLEQSIPVTEDVMIIEAKPLPRIEGKG